MLKTIAGVIFAIMLAKVFWEITFVHSREEQKNPIKAADDFLAAEKKPLDEAKARLANCRSLDYTYETDYFGRKPVGEGAKEYGSVERCIQEESNGVQSYQEDYDRQVVHHDEKVKYLVEHPFLSRMGDIMWNAVICLFIWLYWPFIIAFVIGLLIGVARSK